MSGTVKRQSLRRWRSRPGIESLEGRVVLSSATFSVLENWGSGLTGEIRIENTDSTAVTDWVLEFDYTSSLSSIWDARIVSHAGDHYVIAGASWNPDIPANGPLTFGFVANPGGSAVPSHFKLSGVALGDVPTGPPAPPTPSLSIGDVSLAEGNEGTTDAVFTVALSEATTQPVTVAYATGGGTAQAPSDYTPTSGTLTFAPGERTKTVRVAVLGDTVPEADESFIVNLSAPTNATIERGQGVGTIRNDDSATQPDAPPTAGEFQFVVTSDWGSGFNGQITAKNLGGQGLAHWRIEFDLPAAITSIWDAEIVSRTGTHYVVKGVDWNETIAAGGTVSFGFTATPGGASASATNFVLLGETGPGGGTPPAPNPSPLPEGTVWPAQVFAPYVDMTLYPMYDLATVAQSQGLRYFTLAFVVADANQQPAWGGYSAYGVGDGGEFDTAMKAQIAAVRELGGDVMVSFGGAANQELAEVITDPTALKAAYRKVIDTYKLTNLDFDIEGAAQTNREAIDRRSQVLKELQEEYAADGKTLSIRLTLPVLPTGLTDNGLYVVGSALRYGVDLKGVNLMAMDYGDSAAPNPQGKMGDYAIQAATSTFNQLKGLYGPEKSDAQVWSLVGVTPMIGMNDVQSEIFDQQEARELYQFAQQRKLGLLAFWSLHRDRQNPNGAINYVEITSSSISQSPFEFSRIFKPFTL